MEFVLSIVLMLLLAIDVFKSGRLHVPFELFWPCALLIILGNPWYALFFAVVHFADSRTEILRWLLSGCCSTVVMVVVLRLAPAAGAIPSTILLPASCNGGAVKAAWGAIFAALEALVVIFFLIAEKTGGFHLVVAKRQTWLRFMLAIAALFLAMFLVQNGARIPLGGVGLSAREFAGYLLGLWLIARVIAKVETARRRSGFPCRRRRERTGTAEHLHEMLLIMAAVTAVFYSLRFLIPGIPWPFLLGLIAAYSIPGRGAETPPRRGRPIWAIPFACLIAWNLWHVDSQNFNDPRHYMPRYIENALATPARTHALAKDMELVESKYPAERQTHLALAYAELEGDCIYRAAAEFAEAVRPVERERLILPPPSEDERKQFLQLLRDYCSALPHPERSFAYERALIANGQIESALSLLKLRVGNVEKDESLSRKPFQAAVVFLLGAEAHRDRFTKFPPAAFSALLRNWGAAAPQPRKGKPGALLPVVAAAQYGAHFEKLLVATPRDTWQETRVLSGRVEADEKDWPEYAWLLAMRNDMHWRTSLTLPSGKSRPVVTIAPDASLSADTQHFQRIVRAPDTPAIAMWLP